MADIETIYTHIKNARFVPGAYKNMINGGFSPGATPEQFDQSARLVRQLVSFDPGFQKEFSEQDMAVSDYYGLLLDSGIAPPDAAKTVLDTIKVKDDASLSKRYAGLEDVDKGNEKVLEKNLFTGLAFVKEALVRGTPELNDQMRIDYTRLVKASYVRNGGNLDAARQTALSLLRRSWGETSVGEEKKLQPTPISGLLAGGARTRARRFQKHSPEALFGIPGKSNEWMYEQLESDLAQMFPEAKLKIEDVVLVPEQDIRGNIGYQVMKIVDRDARLVDPLVEPGAARKPLRWLPNYAESPEQKRLIERRKQMEKERAMRVQESINFETQRLQQLGLIKEEPALVVELPGEPIPGGAP